MILIKLSYTFTTKKGRRMVHSFNEMTKVAAAFPEWMTSLNRGSTTKIRYAVLVFEISKRVLVMVESCR